jgi:hypothetical protein
MLRTHSVRTAARRAHRFSRTRLWLRRLEDRAVPTVTVTNLNDAGPGSLRQAIIDTNVGGIMAFDNDIDFAIGLTGTITLTSGPLVINDLLTITGPGSGNLTVSGNNASRVFDIAVAAGSLNAINISGLTVTGGSATTDGGGITIGDESVTLTDVVVTGNKTTLEGGGINVSTGVGHLTLIDCVVSNNSAGTGGNDGGGINFDVTSTNNVLTVTRSTISGNFAGDDGGGIYFFSGGTFNLTDSTVSGNVAAADDGGGIYLFNTTTVITNRTISGNTSGDDGGGITARSTTNLTVNNSTIVFNKSGATAGGGIANAGAAVITLNSTIVAQNTGVAAPDIRGAANIDFSLVGNNVGATLTDVSGFSKIGDVVGGFPAIDPVLGLLANYGGKTATHLPAAGSAARDAGSNVLGLTEDQRGLGFARLLGAQVDIGSVESDGTQPVTFPGTFADVVLGGGTVYSLTAKFTDDTSMKVSTFDNTDIRITGPGGFDVLATFKSAAPGTGAATEVATYEFTPPGGSWDFGDNGVYTVSLESGQVSDAAGQFVVGGTLGTFRVAVGKTFSVSNDLDAGAGSLRQAILDANASAGSNDTITFDPTFFATARTIAVTAGEMAITDSLTISGPGNNMLTLFNLKANSGTSRIFNIAGTGILTVNIADLSLAGGNTSSAGGAVTITDEVVTFTNCVFFANQSTSTGGGAVALTGGGKLTLANCVLAGNTAAGSATDGGAVRGAAGSTVTVQSSSITGNTAGDDGGAFYLTGASLLVEASTVSGNTGNDQGGGFFLTGTPGSLLVSNSTVEGNKAADGGGFRLSNLNTQLVIRNSTITSNTASVNGGGINRFGGTGTIQVTSSIISGNIDTSPVPADQPDVYSNSSFYYGTSAIGSSNGILSPVDQGGNLPTGTPLGLTPLSGNGGPTLTVRPSTGSAVLNVGSNPAGLVADQRGAPRDFGGVDIGSVELNADTPTATSAMANVNTLGGTTYTFQVTYADDVAIDVSTLDSSDIRVLGPGGFNVLATFKSVDVGSNGTPRVATYEFTPPGGSWTSGDNGLYGVYSESGQVADTAGNFVPGGLQGFFVVTVPNTFVVTTTADAGPGSLRDTVALAVATPGPDIITFDTAGAFAGAATINLTGGSIAIGDSMSIAGTGASKLTVNNTKAASTTSHVFAITGAGTLVVNVSDLTISGGNTTTTGGGVTMADESVTFTNVTFTGNKTSSTGGGAVGMTTGGGRLFLINSTVTGNSVTGTADGGAIRATTGTFITGLDSVISGNTSADDAGAIYSTGGSLAILNSSVVNNTATGTGSDGGAVFLAGTAGAAGWLIRNSTLSGNNAKINGGAVALSSTASGTLVVQNSTITANTAQGLGVNQGGGGFHSADTTSPYTGLFNIESTILSNNTNANAPDVSTKGTLDYKNSALGSLTGVGGPNDLGGNLGVGTPLLLGGLTYNGGPAGMLTHLPGGVSPVRDAGTNPAGLANDQRGAGFPRLLNAGVDIGAIESVGGVPSASGTFANVVVAGGTAYTFQIQYSDETSVKVSTMDSNDIRVTGPGGFNVLATFKSVTPGTNAPVETATYEFTPPGGSWDGTDNGIYTLSVEPNQVTDNSGNAVPAGSVGTFLVGIPRNLVVLNANDSGAGSLRQALLDANAIPSLDTISFDPGFFGVARTISLTSGELPVGDSVIINGPGAGLLTVSGNAAGRVLNINGSGVITVNISGLTVTGGKAAPGGGILIDNEIVTLSKVVVSGNAATATGGGGIALATSGGSLTLSDSTVSGNTATGSGGGIRAVAGTSVTLTNTTVANNTSSGVGGGLAMIGNATLAGAVSLSVFNSTVSGNSAAGDGGGGVYWFGVVGGGGTGFVVQNSTFSGNKTTTGNGGAIRLRNMDGTLTVRNATFANNSTTGNGGGIDWFHPDTFAPLQTVAVDVESTVFGGNAAGIGGADIRNDNNIFIPPVNLKTTSIQDTFGFTFSDLGGNLLGVDPLLLPLANNGGPTQTHLPGLSSPVLNVGSNPASLTTDQRGAGFPRLVGVGVDMGAVELDPNIPQAVAALANVTAPGGTAYAFTVTYSDNVAIDVSTLDNNDIRVTGPGGFNVLATFKSVDINTDGTPRVATYEFTPPGGAWDQGDNGSYTVSMEPGQVTDTGATPVPAGTLGAFTVAIPLFLVVNATNDEATDTDGKTSLREAIIAANAAPTADVISFDPVVFATAKTITLTVGTELAITDSVTINGPGGGRVTVDGNATSRIFNVDGTGTLVVGISGLTLTNGKATGDGGAIRVADEDLTLSNLVVTGNAATTDGGALTVTAATSKVTINDSTFKGNTASSNGGAVNVDTTGTLVVNRSTFSGNTAGADGGGIYFFSGGSLTMDSSTVSGNSANTVTTSVGGGGIYFFGTVSAGGFTITNSTISGNSTAKNAGGGVVLALFTGNALFQNSTITNNSASTNGGGIARTGGSGTVTLQSTIVAGNANANTPDVSFNTLSDIAGDNNLIGAADVGNFTTSGFGNLTGTQAAPLDPLLSGLGNFGGPTQTHALQAGSPALNAGNNNAALTADQRGGTFVRVSGASADIGAFEAQPPRVLAVVVNDGAAQRSIVTKLTVTFSEAVAFPGGVAAAFQLNRVGPGLPTGLVNLNAVQSGNSVELTFATGGAVGVDPGNSLKDGSYQLTVLSAGVQGPAGFLDGNGDGTPGDNFLTPTTGAGRVHRLFGDNDGDGDVDAQDFGAFRGAFGGTSNLNFDFDQDGDVDAQDFGQFRARFGSSV